MLPFEADITSKYNSDELLALGNKTKNFQCENDPELGYFSKYMFFPLAILNPNKGIKTHLKKLYSISAAEATERLLNNLICTEFVIPENTLHLSYTIIKRGNSFIHKHLEEQGYTFLDRISLYLQIKATHKIRVYRKDQHIAIVTNESKNDELDKRIFSAFPLLFKDDFTWNEEVINYFKSSFEAPETAISLYKTLVEKSKILESLKKELLERMLDFTVTTQKREYQRTLDQINKDIANYEHALIKQYQLQKEFQAKITFFNVKQDTSEIANYILNNPYIVDYYSRNDKYFIVAIEAPLEFVDVPALKKMLANINSYLYPHYQSTVPDSIQNHEQDFILMLKDLFITGKYKVYTRAEIVFDFENKTTYPLRYAGNHTSSRLANQKPEHWSLKYRYKNNSERCITPHMHIEYYDCWSGNKTNIAKALANNDIIGALDIAISTTKDINVNDSTVFARFLNQGLYNPFEFTNNGTIDTSLDYRDKMPGNQFKTIYDPAQKCFRTFDDIFQNDYIKGRLTQADIEEDLSDYIL